MKGMRRPFSAAIASTGLLLPAAMATAEDPFSGARARDGSMDPRRETWQERDHLTGDWHGVRQRWREQGVTLHGEWIGETWANLEGGLSTGVVAEGLAQLNLDLDLDRLVGWRGGEIRLGGIFPHGESPTRELTGDLLGVSNIDAFRDEVAPYEMWYQQSFGEDAWNLRTGLLVADGEFAFTEGGSVFLNSAFGWPAGIALNSLNTGPAYFRSALGLRLRHSPNASWQWQVAAYDGDTFDGDPDRDSVTDLGLGGDDGWFLLGEVARFGTGGDEGPEGLQLRLGGWLHTASFGESMPERSRGGLYLSADAELWSSEHGSPASTSDTQDVPDPGPAVSVFARLEWSPRTYSLVEWSGHGGLLCEGLLPSRFDDAIGLGVAWARGSVTGTGDAFDGSLGEVAVELTWRIALTPWWEIQPDFQWILAMDDASRRPNAHVIGIRTHLTF